MEPVILGGGYTCSVCGQYQRTSALCHHNNNLIPEDIIKTNMKSKEEIEQLAANLANPNVCKTTNWIEGYTQCQEDNKDKKYTEEDLREAISLARKTRVNVFGANGEESIGFVHSNNEILKIVTNKQD